MENRRHQSNKPFTCSRTIHNPTLTQPNCTGYWSFKGSCSNRKWIIVVVVKREEQFYSGDHLCSAMIGCWVLFKEKQDATETKATEE